MSENSKIITVTVGEGQASERIDAYLSKSLPQYSRTQIKSWISEGRVCVSGTKVRPSYKITEGETIEVEPGVVFESSVHPIEMDLEILFEDEHLIVINKPAGLSVHPGAGYQATTLVHGLLHHCKNLSSTGGDDSEFEDEREDLRPGIVHRLDKDTTGAIVCAKTNEAHRHLAAQFKNKTNHRVYVALLDGLMKEDQAVVESYLTRNPKNRMKMKSMGVEEYKSTVESRGKKTPIYRYAKSTFTKKHTYRERLSLVQVKLDTGRTHQIRVHSKDLELGIVGDLTYHRHCILPEDFDDSLRHHVRSVDRQMLHARELGFEHPVTGEMLLFKAPFPKDFENLLLGLEPYRDK
jgi:23S rRNA pseudouridine1911/1915/1917 synthase